MAQAPETISTDPRDRMAELHRQRRDILRRIHGAKMRKDWNARKAANSDLEKVEDLIAYESVMCSPSLSLSPSKRFPPRRLAGK